MSLKKECKKIQDLILENYLKRNSLDGLSPEIIEHISHCTQCKAYSEGISFSKELFQDEKLFSEELKIKTLRAVTLQSAKEKSSKIPWILLVLFAITSVAFSICLPLYLVHSILCSLNLSSLQSIIASVFIYISIGVIINLYFFIAMKERFFSNIEKSVPLEEKYV